MDSESTSPPPETSGEYKPPIDLNKVLAEGKEDSNKIEDLLNEKISPISAKEESVSAKVNSPPQVSTGIPSPPPVKADQKSIFERILPQSPKFPKQEEIVVIEDSSKNSVKAIRTYQSDVAESVKENKTSVAHMVIAEEARKRRLSEFDSPGSKRNITFVFLGLALIAMGGFTALFIYNKEQRARTAIQGAQNQSLIFAENHRSLSVTGLGSDALAKAIGTKVRNANNKLDTIENISFSEKEGAVEVPVTTERFFFFLDTRIPSALLRSLDPVFMFGIHTFNGNRPFLIFQTNYYENSFAGMLGWEQYMARDLFPIFSIQESPTSEAFNRPFEDVVIKNRDTRVLKDNNGNVILFYTFANKKTLIIANSSDTLEEIIRRLNSSGVSGR